MLVGQPVTVWSVYQFVCGATVTLVAWYTEWWFKRPVGHWRNCQSVSLYWPVWQSVGHWRNCQSVSLYWPVGWSLILHWPVEQTVGWSLKELVSRSVYWSVRQLVGRPFSYLENADTDDEAFQQHHNHHRRHQSHPRPAPVYVTMPDVNHHVTESFVSRQAFLTEAHNDIILLIRRETTDF